MRYINQITFIREANERELLGNWIWVNYYLVEHILSGE